MFSFIPSSKSLSFEPLRALSQRKCSTLPHTLLPKLKGYKDTVRWCATLIVEVRGKDSVVISNNWHKPSLYHYLIMKLEGGTKPKGWLGFCQVCHGVSKMFLWVCTSKGRIVILEQIVSASGQILRPDFRPCDEMFWRRMAFRTLDE